MGAIPVERQRGPGDRLPSLTGLRWFAALAVFCSHTAWAWNASILKRPFLEIARPGVTGVTFFFVLSGFVLTWSHTETDSPRAFYRRRFARIAPAYWASIVITVVIGALWHGGISGRSLAADLGSLSFLQAWVPDQTINYGGNGTGWSLSAEGFFYALAPFLIAALLSASSRRVTCTAVAMFVIATSWALIWHPPTDLGNAFWWVYIFPPARLLEFVIGICACVLVRRGARVPLSRAGASAIAIGAFLISAHVPNYFMWTVTVVIPFTLLIMVCAQADLAGDRSMLGHPVMQRLGQWSYAFYLIQGAVFVVLSGHSPHSIIAAAALWLLTLAATILAAAAIFGLIEHPLERRLRPPRRDLGEAAPSAVSVAS